MNHMQAETNIEYIESLYQQYKSSPESVNPDWRRFFEGVDFASGATGAFGFSEAELNVYQLIQAYRMWGHLEADLDPLTNSVAPCEQLRIEKFKLTQADLEKKFQIGNLLGLKDATLKEIIEKLKTIYCGHVAVQLGDAFPEIQNWFHKEFEQSTSFKLSNDEKKEILKSLTKAESLEKFFHTRYVGTKRFSVEGADAVLPMLDYTLNKGSTLQIKELVLGMAHRGRINVLVNFLEKDLATMFADLNGLTELEKPLYDFDGDVKYHLGYHKVKKASNGAEVDTHLAFNPSHLETVNPVVLGMARAAQRLRKNTKDRNEVLPVLIHGDAAFAGQGVVMEILQMAHVRGYNVGGTIHIVIDNQVGFTTNPENARSSHYAADPAKITSSPVLMCNGDDVESCIRALDIAIRYRQEWKRDVVINLVCYRRYGHNEGDEPAYTQPLMYDIIRQHPTLREIYGKRLIAAQVCDQNYVDSLSSERMNELQKIFESAKEHPPKIKNYKFEGPWKGLKKADEADVEKSIDTSIDLKKLKKIGELIATIPSGFNLHPKLVKLIESRKNMADGKESVDWGMAELLAYGSLIDEGTSVRLTGQDCVRGTFTHRHSGFYDTKTGEAFFPLKQLNSEKTNFCVYDSILSEYAVMGFEYGNSIYDPSFLTMWEAQFGDFVNGAQIIIDQYLSAAEAKWQQMSGLVLLLPHGYEGQGPEHSSARPERFLQLFAQNNIQVCNLTTPSQVFHIFRRQVMRDFRKPLVIMTPKSLLRHPRATNTIEEIATGGFQEVLDDQLITDKKKVEKLVFVSGKLYYELLEEREKNKNTKTALIRLEQIAPFPDWKLKDIFKSYPNANKVIWTQEEPKNMGAYSFVYFKFTEFLANLKKQVEFIYVGRPDRASPAVGSIFKHKIEQQQIITDVFKA